MDNAVFKRKVTAIVMLRGVPGAGKTTLAEALATNHTLLVAADDYMLDEDGNYLFNPNRLKLCHYKCKMAVEDGINHGRYSKIIVHNTSTQEWEMKPYFDLAEKYDINIYSVIVESRHGSHNIHDVPFHSIVAMKDRFEVEL